MHKKKTAASRIPPTPLHHTLNIKEKRRGSDDIHMYSYSSIQLTSLILNGYNKTDKTQWMASGIVIWLAVTKSLNPF